MKWKYFSSGFNTGKKNMEIDLQLARINNAEDVFLRFYRWQPYCISLGANQNIEIIDEMKCSGDNIDIVKRPTGGRAILHAEELTYSVVFPIKLNYTPSVIYREINYALMKGLEFFDSRLKEAELENLQPDFSSVYKTVEGNACFATAAKSELKYSGRKLIGSAQRKLGSVVLQHGSILCGSFHKRITNYLKIDRDEKLKLLNELNGKTVEIDSILDQAVDYNKLEKSLLKGFEQHFNISVQKESDHKF